MVNQQQQQINENLKIEAIRWYQKLQEITYLEAGQHMRALNQLMWQIPSFVIAVNGGLWYATTLANESSLWIIFAVLALFDFTTMITLYRLRSLIGSKIALQKNIEDRSVKVLSMPFAAMLRLTVVTSLPMLIKKSIRLRVREPRRW